MSCNRINKKKMIVDPDRPLPPELAKEYWETSAKLILEKFFPKRFFDLSIEDEKPDLRNKTTGVEVTSAEDKESQEMDSLYSRQYTYGSPKQREKDLKRIEELGGRAEKYCLVHPGRSRDLGKIYCAVKIKTKKLNTSYDVFPRNYLFVYDSCLILNQELPEMLSAMSDSSADYKIKFDSIFLYCFGGDLYEFDLRNNTYTHINDSSKIVQQLVIDARNLINKKYKE